MIGDAVQVDRGDDERPDRGRCQVDDAPAGRLQRRVVRDVRVGAGRVEDHVDVVEGAHPQEPVDALGGHRHVECRRARETVTGGIDPDHRSDVEHR